MINAGLLGYFGEPLAPGPLHEALNRAPWRGQPSAVLNHPFGMICALGSAESGTFGHISVALHGRIDNLRIMASELGIAVSDPCEIISAAYQSFGDEFARRLLGDFAILVLDTQRRALVAARDWIGAKPLFWGQHGDRFAFGSEIKQVMALLGIQMDMDPQVMDAYRSGRPLPINATFARNCWAVMPTGQAVIQVGRPPQAWRCPPRFSPRTISLDEAVPHLINLLETAVTRRATGERVGSFLSGGMDSTTVTAVAAACAEQGRSAPLGGAFTFVYSEIPACDETIFASEVAARWNVPWYAVDVQTSQVRDSLGETLTLHDGPVFPGVGELSQLMRVVQRTGINILLSGQGADAWQDQRGDELELLLLRNEWKWLCRWSLRGAQKAPRHTARLLCSAIHSRLRRKRAEEIFEERTADFWSRLALETEEREGMRHGIQVEFPFCDRELAVFLAELPVTIRSLPGITKRVTREAMRERLPEKVRLRMDKTYFDAYLDAVLDDGLGEETVMERWRTLQADTACRLWDPAE